MRTTLLALIGLSVLLSISTESPLNAQVIGSSTLDINASVVGVESLGKSMAADAYGNVFLVDVLATAGPLTTYRFSRIAFDNTVTVTFATLSGGGPISRLCQNPQDGYVYFAHNPAPSGTPATTIYRLNPDLGIVAYFSTDVDAVGLAIDNSGMYYLGGLSASVGQGIHRVPTPSSVGGFHASTMISGGHGFNRLLLSMIDGTLLAADGTLVWRINPAVGGAGLLYFAYSPAAGETATLHSMARSPLNEFGVGALLGVRSSLNNGYAFLGDETGATQTNPVLSESFNSVGAGPIALCTRMGDEVQWLTATPGVLGMVRTLWRIRQLPDPTVPGSLSSSSIPGSFSVSLTGRPTATGIQVGISPGISFIPHLYLPHGTMELDLANLGVISLVNGLGIHGPADGSNIPPSGTFTATFNLPPFLPPGLPVTLQAVVCDVKAANGFYDKSNLVVTFLP